MTLGGTFTINGGVELGEPAKKTEMEWPEECRGGCVEKMGKVTSRYC